MRNEKLLTLPIGVQSFDMLRQDNLLYVDKTARLRELVTSGRRYFLSRPRRFGKSLTLSTLDAMFSGKAELFRGLAAEAWVSEQAEHPSPVLRFDISSLQAYSSAESLDRAIILRLREFAEIHEIALTIDENERCGEIFRKIILNLFKMRGPVVVLIDEYDKPMLDNIGNLEAANEMRQVLRSFYTVLKGCDEYLRFVMLMGISKFSKTGVFSAMNNLQDISMNRQYGDIVGYTQQELENFFSDWIDSTTKAISLSREELLRKIRDYYDGFSFDGNTRLYNPFSILNFFSEGKFKNYWYTSGSSSFIVTYMKQHGIQDPEEYSHIEVSEDFADAHEIESATPESFLYQSGYLTLEKWEEDTLTLDYPNYEVRKSLVRMYLDSVYHVKNYITLGTKLWRALSEGNVEEAVDLFNIALSGIPYTDFANQGERFYRSLFLMLLRGAGITANGEVPTNLGRSDALIQFPNRVVVLEFKYAKDNSEVDSKREEGEKQIQEKNYAKPYEAENRAVTTAVIVVDGEKREAVL